MSPAAAHLSDPPSSVEHGDADTARLAATAHHARHAALGHAAYVGEECPIATSAILTLAEAAGVAPPALVLDLCRGVGGALRSGLSATGPAATVPLRQSVSPGQSPANRRAYAGRLAARRRTRAL